MPRVPSKIKAQEHRVLQGSKISLHDRQDRPEQQRPDPRGLRVRQVGIKEVAKAVLAVVDRPSTAPATGQTTDALSIRPG